jgi:protein transport protein SEC24
MPPRPDLNHNMPSTTFPHRPDRPEHLQRYHHQPMPVIPPGPPLDHHQQQPPNSIPPLFQQPNQQPRSNGPRNRIDPNQIPSPVIVHEQDATTFSEEPFRTCQSIYATSNNMNSFAPNIHHNQPPPPPQIPLSLTDYVSIDEGNCSPRFIRATTYCLPAVDDIAQAAELPLGLVIQPLAELAQGEGDIVPVVDFSQDPTGPPRCSSCRGYINPWCTFIDGGNRFRCNLCGKPSDGTYLLFFFIT